MHLNGMALQASITITNEPGRLPRPTLPASHDQTPSQFYSTNTLSCDSYDLILFVIPGQRMDIDHFDFVPCQTSVDGSQSTTASVPAASSSAAVSNSTTSPLSASASSPKPLSAGLIVGLVLSSFLLVCMLCGVVLLLFMRRRQRSSSGPGLWSSLPGRGEPKSPSQALLEVGGGIGGVEDRPRTRFGLYMFKFKPASDTPMRDPSPPPAAEGKSPTPGPTPAPPQVWFDPSVEKPPQYTGGDWTADTESGGQVLRGYLPDSKEWIAQELEGVEEGSSSEWGTVPTNHAVESVPRGEPSGSSRWT